MATATQEQDGSTSMRRILAANFAVIGDACFVLSAATGAIEGVYAGSVCGALILVLLGYTTIESVFSIVKKVSHETKGGKCVED